MKRFAPAFLAVLLVSGFVLALSQSTDASPSNWERDKRRLQSYLQDHCASALSIFSCVSSYNFKR
jgi:hypothetical protein